MSRVQATQATPSPCPWESPPASVRGGTVHAHPSDEADCLLREFWSLATHIDLIIEEDGASDVAEGGLVDLGVCGSVLAGFSGGILGRGSDCPCERYSSRAEGLHVYRFSGVAPSQSLTLMI